MEYNETDYNYHHDDPEQERGASSVKGLKIAIIILIVILAAISFQYWRQVQNLRGNETELLIEKDTLTSRLAALQTEMGGLQVSNDTMNLALSQQRRAADSLMQRLKSERSLSYAKIKKYERELGTMRSTMQGFIRQIDSLDRLNRKLTGENLQMKKEMTSYRTRAEMAEETSQELGNKIKRGSILRARDIRLDPLNAKDKPTGSVKRAAKLVASFTLAANELTTPGDRTVYVRIITPDAEILGNAGGATFTFEGERIVYTAKRDNIQYQNDDLPVSIFFECSGLGLYGGKYTVMIYVDGMMVGSGDVILK